jgi:hypothetical protein
MSDKLYPRRCPTCGRHEVILTSLPDYKFLIKHCGHTHNITIPFLPVDRCSFCGELLYGNESDDAIEKAVEEHKWLVHSS